MTTNINTNGNGLMDTLARWQHAMDCLKARYIDTDRLGRDVAAVLEVHARVVGASGDLEALVAILEAVVEVMGVGVGTESSLSYPRVVPVPAMAVVPTDPVMAAPVAPAPASVTAPVALASTAPVAPASTAPVSPAEIEATFAAQIGAARSLRELATIGVKVARAGLQKDATDRLQGVYQGRKAALVGKVPAGAAPAAPTESQAPVVPRGAAQPAPMPPAAPTPVTGPVVAPGGAVGGGSVGPAEAMDSHRWVAARFFAGGGRQILGYVSAPTDQEAIGAAERKWGTGGGVGVMDLAICSALELAEADKAVGRAAPAGVGGNGGRGGKKISIEMPVGFTEDPDSDAQEEA